MKVLIVSGGTAPSSELLKKEAQDSDYIICADSGANCLYENNIYPQMILGDFDSIKKDILLAFKNNNCKVISFPKEKDSTDSEIAVEEAIKLQPDTLVLLGFTGTRIDHFLGNLGLLSKCLSKRINAVLKDSNNTVFITDKPIKIKGKRNNFFSIQAYCDKVQDLTILGAKYPLYNYELKLGDSRTISNEFLDNEVEINFSTGKILIILSKD